MARPRNQELKEKILAAREAGASIDELCRQFGLARNTIFFHLKSMHPERDGRAKYTREQKEYLAGLTAERLKEVAARTGRSFAALQRVASRERQKQKENLKARVIVRGYLDISKSRELRLFGFELADVVIAERSLRLLGLHLEAPNILAHVSGKFQPLVLADQIEIIKEPMAFLKAAQGRLKGTWRTKE